MQRTIATLGLMATIVIAACGGATNTGGGASPTASAAGSAAATAATAAPVTLTIMVGGLNKQIYLPNKLTEALGYFKDQNLTVNLIDEPSGKDATTALIAGEVEASSGSYDHTIDVAGLGKNLVEVVQLMRAPGEAEMVATTKANDIKGPADFKGRKLGVTSIGSGTHGLTQYLASTKGIAPDQFTPIAVGAGDTFIAAIKQGTIDAGMTTEPTISRLLKTGDAKVLIDLQTYNKNVQGKTIDLTKTWTNEYVDAAK